VGIYKSSYLGAKSSPGLCVVKGNVTKETKNLIQMFRIFYFH